MCGGLAGGATACAALGIAARNSRVLMVSVWALMAIIAIGRNFKSLHSVSCFTTSAEIEEKKRLPVDLPAYMVE